MKKLYPVVSLLLSAGLVAALYVYLKIASLFLFGHAYYSSPLSHVAQLGSIALAYLIVAGVDEHWKPSVRLKAIVLAAITIIPMIVIKIFL